MAVSGYTITNELVRDDLHVVYRARRDADGRPVLLKGPAAFPPLTAHGAALRREFALLGELEIEGVPRARELVREDGDWWLVLDDPGGEPLSSRTAGGPADLAFFFPVALRIAGILAELHDRDVVHRGLRPRRIFVDPASREVWLDGFGHAVRAASGVRTPPALQRSGFDLAYVSPEQTGRMNRATDHRTDFYSLGATFHEMLTGTPPFRSTDPLALIHAHIARTPPSVAELRPEIPETLSRIVSKLLGKTAEARYQSARGLRADLEMCARDWSARREIAPFALGAHDVSDRFLIPQHLYGRDREAGELLSGFERVCGGETALMLVSGYSGIGKSSLIQEIDRPIVRERGYFVTGKFDQVVRNLPYGAILQAFRGLVQQLLAEPEERQAAWRRRLGDALGTNAGVVAEVIPEIELLLGPSAPVPPLPPAESQNRFRLVFQNLVGALADRKHPLVVFLDDLQWADPASLALLPALLTSPEIRCLYLIGAYRDNEVDASHPLSLAVGAAERTGARVRRIFLGPLAVDDLRRFAADCLRRPEGEVQGLAELLSAKTEGNPFFVIQFLKTLRQERLLEFDHAGGRFTFDLEAVAGAPMTDNVVELMSHKINRLSPAARTVLTRAACVGSPFDLETLAIVGDETPPETAERVEEAVREGLVLRAADPGRDETYAFLHDRVQQAAYARLPERERRELHLAVGRHLRRRFTDATVEERVFDVVAHFEKGIAGIEDASERREVARLHVIAGRRAKSAAAYESARGYFEAAAALHGESLWTEDPAAAFELHREAAECAYLAGSFDEAEAAFERLLPRARTALDRAHVHLLRAVQYENLSRFADSARIALEGLALLGVSFPGTREEKEAALDAEIEGIERLLAGREIASLIDLPILRDPEIRMAMRLLTNLWAPAYIAGDGVLPSLVSARMVALSIRHGNAEDSAYGYVTHAIAVGPARGDYRSAYEWGLLALAVNERLQDPTLRSKVHQQFNAHVTIWRKPFAEAIPHAREACRAGLQYGDLAYAGYGAFTESWPAFLICRDLGAFVEEFVPTLSILRRIRTLGLADAHGVMLAWARALQGRTAGPLSLSGEGFDEERYAAEHRENPFFMTVFHVAKLQLAVQFGDRAAAVDHAREARRLDWGHGTIWPELLTFWGALAETAGAASARERLRVLAENCPENWRWFHLVLESEARRLDGDFVGALERVDEAIAFARRVQHLHHEAFASELCASLWLSRGNDRVASVYLAEARRAYADWGAAAKVRQIDALHPGLAAGAAETGAPALDLDSISRAAHVLSGEILLDELLRKLLRIAIENAGAERALFLRDEDGKLAVEAEIGIDEERIAVAAPIPLEDHGGISRRIVQYVRKTERSLVVGDAGADPRFATDPYVAGEGVRSVVCVPFVHQGRLGGILYLENRLAADAFPDERLRVLDLLASQAAVTVENARLYREKSEEVELRRRAEEGLRRALGEVQALKNRLEAENVYLQEEIRREHNFDEMIGSSPALLQLLAVVERVAPTDSTALVYGETGTGKELIARAIHDRSRRKGRPLVKVNCGAIAEGLVESELFGHVKGAFTGASENRAGRFELADGGTLFLDEIGELPLPTQVKLLRALQEQEFEPVGGTRTVRVDVRVIAATNRDLEGAVKAGRFRADLFYRLNVLPLRVPPLRDRRGDIPQLVSFFVSTFARRFGKDVEGVSKESMDLLMSYGWPGNIRELRNVIERAVVLSMGRVVSVEPEVLGVAQVPESAAVPDGLPLEEVERRHIREVLARTRGVIEGPSGAAKILDLHPNTLRSRMKKLGVSRST